MSSNLAALFVVIALTLFLFRIRINIESEDNMRILKNNMKEKVTIYYSTLELINVSTIEKIWAIIANIVTDWVAHPIHAKGAPYKS